MEREQNERHEELNSRMEREQKERHELNSRMEQEQRERREELDRKVEEIMLQVKEYDSAERQERQQLQGQLRELWDKLDEEIKKRLETGINRVVNLKHLKLNFLPFEFEMKNFTNYKKNGIAWDSPPFYTIDGYKMRIRVEAKGYVSVSALRMAGLVDDDLRWPFKQNITIMLMNQASSWNLFSYYFWMTESQIGTLQFTKQ